MIIRFKDVKKREYIVELNNFSIIESKEDKGVFVLNADSVEGVRISKSLQKKLVEQLNYMNFDKAKLMLEFIDFISMGVE